MSEGGCGSVCLCPSYALNRPQSHLTSSPFALGGLYFTPLHLPLSEDVRRLPGPVVPPPGRIGEKYGMRWRGLCRPTIYLSLNPLSTPSLKKKAAPGGAATVVLVTLAGYFSCGPNPTKSNEIQINATRSQTRPEFCWSMDLVGFRWISLDFVGFRWISLYFD